MIPAGNLLATLDRAGTLGKRARDATQVAPTRGTADLPNVFRKPHGPGWALVGDAGLTMDPITGLGMGHALRDAELASAAIIAGLGQPGRLGAQLAGYARQRDKQTRQIYDFTVGLASLTPATAAKRRMFAAIAASPQHTSALFGTLNGSLPMRRLFSPKNLIKMVGV